MPLIQSTVTARFINRTDLAEAVQSHKDPLSVSPKLLELQARLHASGTYRATSAPNETYFDIGVGETKMAPEWVKTDWGYYAHLINAQNGGKGIVDSSRKHARICQRLCWQFPPAAHLRKRA